MLSRPQVIKIGRGGAEEARKEQIWTRIPYYEIILQ